MKLLSQRDLVSREYRNVYKDSAPEHGHGAEIDAELLQEDPSLFLDQLQHEGEAFCETCLQYFLDKADLVTMTPKEIKEVLKEIESISVSAETDPDLLQAMETFKASANSEVRNRFETLKSDPEAFMEAFVENGSPVGLPSGTYMPFVELYGSDVIFENGGSYFASIDGKWTVIYKEIGGTSSRKEGDVSDGVGNGTSFTITNQAEVDVMLAAHEQAPSVMTKIESAGRFDQVQLLEEIAQYLHNGDPLDQDLELSASLGSNPSEHMIARVMKDYPETALFEFIQTRPFMAENLFVVGEPNGPRELRLFGNGALNTQGALEEFLTPQSHNDYVITGNKGSHRYWVRTMAGYRFIGADTPAAQGAYQIGQVASVGDGLDFKSKDQMPTNLNLTKEATLLIGDYVGKSPNERISLERKRRENFAVEQQWKNYSSEVLSGIADVAGTRNNPDNPLYDAVDRLSKQFGGQGSEFRQYLEAKSADPETNWQEFSEEARFKAEQYVSVFFAEVSQLAQENPAIRASMSDIYLVYEKTGQKLKTDMIVFQQQSAASLEATLFNMGASPQRNIQLKQLVENSEHWTPKAGESHADFLSRVDRLREEEVLPLLDGDDQLSHQFVQLIFSRAELSKQAEIVDSVVFDTELSHAEIKIKFFDGEPTALTGIVPDNVDPIYFEAVSRGGDLPSGALDLHTIQAARTEAGEKRAQLIAESIGLSEYQTAYYQQFGYDYTASVDDPDLVEVSDSVEISNDITLPVVDTYEGSPVYEMPGTPVRLVQDKDSGLFYDVRLAGYPDVDEVASATPKGALAMSACSSGDDFSSPMDMIKECQRLQGVCSSVPEIWDTACAYHDIGPGDMATFRECRRSMNRAGLDWPDMFAASGILKGTRLDKNAVREANLEYNGKKYTLFNFMRVVKHNPAALDGIKPQSMV